MSSNIWVISDTHFGHDNIIKYCERPFKDSAEMDEYILESWNSVVKPGDKVYHLGDVYFGQRMRKGEGAWGNFFSRLNGHKRLILGNHDDGKDQNLLNTFNKIMIWRMFPEFGLLLTHVPVHPSALRRSDKGNDKNPPMLKNIHGHIHNNFVMIGDSQVQDKRYQNVCVEKTKYTPVNIEDLRTK